jgi:hypothetical protein
VASPTYFTVEADFRAIVGDTINDDDYDPDILPVSASVLFSPLLNAGDLILATQADPRPTGFLAAPVAAVVDPADGRLKIRVPVREDGDPEFGPVRLLADTPLLELKSPLYYRVTFTNVTVGGKPSSIAAFVFQAANADVIINLIGVMRQPGQSASGITKIAPGAVRLLDDGRVQFSFSGVDIPDPLDLTIIDGSGGLGTGAGTQGPPGPPGPPGEQGSVWHFGDGPPGTIIGSKPGDIYVDSNGTIYQLGE